MELFSLHCGKLIFGYFSKLPRQNNRNFTLMESSEHIGKRLASKIHITNGSVVFSPGSTSLRMRGRDVLKTDCTWVFYN
jgi:hypothetical protein